MKITIVQREIEEAVRSYIHSQIAVKEGMEITMDFTATRGEDGLTAAIDISPAKTAEPAKATRTPRAATVSAAPRQVAPQAAAPAPASVTEVEPAPEPDESEEVEEQTASAPASEPTDEDESLVEGDQPLKPSIFSNLRRPVNASSDA